VEKCIAMPQAIEIVENAFKAHGQGLTQMPAKIYLHLDKYNGDFRAMPAYVKEPEACGIKWVNVHPDNKKYGLPSVMALIILSDSKTGFPLAIMDGTSITNLRTGAAGAVAAKYLARTDSKRIALIGCGVQATTQLMALREVFPISTVSVFDSLEPQANAFIKKTRSLVPKIKKHATIAECLNGADIIVTTTPSREPIVQSQWVAKGAHINAIGADAKGKEELDPKILTRAKVVVDDITQALHSGEINVPVAKNLFRKSQIYADLGEIVTEKKAGRQARDEITLFDSTGLAILDIALAQYAYLQAVSVNRRKLRKIKFY